MLYRRFLTYAWVALLLTILAFWVRNPAIFTEEHFALVLRHWGPWAMPGFIIIALLRGAVLLPSTPVVLAGGAFFPESLPLVLAVSMAGILLSATFLYRFPGFAGYDSMLAARYPVQLAKLQTRLARPEAMWLVAAWSFMLVLPTDLICYAAGLVRMPFRRLLTGVIIGEFPLITAYVFLGAKLAGLLST